MGISSTNIDIYADKNGNLVMESEPKSYFKSYPHTYRINLFEITFDKEEGNKISEWSAVEIVRHKK